MIGQNGPPESEVPAPQREPAQPTTTSAEVDTAEDTRSGRRSAPRTFGRPAVSKPLPRICGSDTAGQLRARRRASYKMLRLDCCGVRDVLDCRCGGGDTTLGGAEAYKKAAQHLLGCGLIPAPDRAGLGLMWKAGGESRHVAQVIAERWDLSS
jgi:hypothetical protein